MSHFHACFYTKALLWCSAALLVVRSLFDVTTEHPPNFWVKVMALHAYRDSVVVHPRLDPLWESWVRFPVLLTGWGRARGSWSPQWVRPCSWGRGCACSSRPCPSAWATASPAAAAAAEGPSERTWWPLSLSLMSSMSSSQLGFKLGLQDLSCVVLPDV